jgi:hypothetical protein
MLRFIAGEGLTPRFKRGLQYVGVIFAGSCLGYLSGKNEWLQKKELFREDRLTEYECEDKINNLIEEKKKPAVIYYYLPGVQYHYLMRANMLKYSNRYPDNAIWVMVNLTQDLQHAKEALKSLIYPDSSIRLEVRFPKENLAIFENDKNQDLKLIKEVYSNRR